MEWDKSFTDNARGINDIGGMEKAPQFISEYEGFHLENVQIVKCGKILWRSIIFGLYLCLVIIVV